MKKISVLLLALLIMFGMFSPRSASAMNAPFVYMKGQKLSFTNQVKTQNGVTFIELRKVFELLGVKLTYTPSTMEITGEKKDYILKTKVGSDSAYINGVEKKMPAPSYAKNSRTMIPLRFLSEHMGLKVDWVKEISSIIITGDNLYSDLTFTKEELNKDLLSQFKEGKLGNFPIGIISQYDDQYFEMLGAPQAVNNKERYYTYGDYRLYYEMFRHGNTYIKELRVYPQAFEALSLNKVRDTLGKPHKMYTDQKTGTTVYVWNDTKHSMGFHFIDSNHLEYISVK
ncbi:hypothetical protein ABID52_000429 [Fictibacillus halophilus]|uniref:Copper amine oxidase-like N-terminal domain-containing protein n=1 Tax=Fictibacillus halophilus TaxID=1610490 RepID=A0ABV2LE36_9BACL